MIRRVGYVLMLILMLSSVSLYSYRGLRFLFAMVLLLPLVCQIFVFLHSLMCRVEVDGKKSVCTRGERIEIPIRIYNKCLFPIARLVVRVEWRFTDGTSKNWTERIENVGGRQKKEWILTLPTEHCGQGVLTVHKTKIYDYLCLCSAKIRGKRQMEMAVLPIIRPLEAKELEELLLSGSFLHGVMEDVEECFVRNYREGDSLHRVHWKLSAKQEELQIREFEEKKRQGVSMFLDFSALWCQDCSREEKADRWDDYLERAVAVSLCLHGGRVGLRRIAWTENGEYVEFEINKNGREDIHACIFRLLRIVPAAPDLSDSGAKAAEVSTVAENGELFLRLDARLKLYWGERCIYE